MHTHAEKRLFLIDGYSYLFRAYHSLPPLTNPEGTSVGALYGFTNMILKLKNKIETNNASNIYMILVFDSGKDTFRNKIYPEYKANRPEAPEDLKPQFPLIRDAAEALNIDVVEATGYEADDIIATYAKKAEAEGFKVTIASIDKDLMQLVNDHVNLYDPMRDRVIGEKEVIEKFAVPPAKVLDVLSLMGDSSDNIPGVPGIGPKTAAELINEYGDIYNLIENLDKIKQEKRRTSLKENIDNIHLSKKLASLAYDVPVDFNFEHFRIRDFDKEKLSSFLAKHNFKSLLTKINPEYNLNNSPQQNSDKNIIEKNTYAKELNPIQINEPADLKDLFNKHSNADILIYFNCAEDNQVKSLFVNFDNHEYCDINIAENEAAKIQNNNDLFSYSENNNINTNSKNKYIELIEEYFFSETINFIFNDIKNLLDKKIISSTPKNFKDITLILYLLGQSKNQEQINHQQLFDIYKEIKSELFLSKQNFIYSEIDLPLIPILNKMEKAGIKIDKNILMRLENEFNLKINELSKNIFSICGTEFNISSPKQLGEILYKKLLLPNPKKTKTGQYVTDSEVLEELSEQGFEIADKIIEYRSLTKLTSTYTSALQKEINPITKRVHTHFNNTATTTGRLSSTDPNLQNIPIRTEEGRKIRTAFIAEDGNLLIGADYSQIELRLLAHMANIDSLKIAFREGKDIHAATASEVFGVPLDQVNSDLRRQAKTVNFGIIYGQSAFGLAKQLKIPRNEAKNIIDKYFIKYAGIKKYMDETIDFARKHGFVQTLFGRKIYLPGINDKNGARRQFQERAAINAPLQGTAADIIKMAMVGLGKQISDIRCQMSDKKEEINNKLNNDLFNLKESPHPYPLPEGEGAFNIQLSKHQNIQASLLLQIHDELIFECAENIAEENAKIVKSIMENVINLSVPLIVDVKTGKNWGEVH